MTSPFFANMSYIFEVMDISVYQHVFNLPSVMFSGSFSGSLAQADSLTEEELFGKIRFLLLLHTRRMIITVIDKKRLLSKPSDGDGMHTTIQTSTQHTAFHCDGSSYHTHPDNNKTHCVTICTKLEV